MDRQDRKQSEGSMSQSSQNSGASIMVRNLGLVGEQVLALQKTEFFRRKPRPAQIGGEEEQRDEGSSIGYSCKDTLFLDSSAPLRLESVLNFMGSKSSTPRENPRVLLASTGSIEDSARAPLESPKETNVITSSPRKLFLSPSNQNYQPPEQMLVQSSPNTASKTPSSPQVGASSKASQVKGQSPDKVPAASPFVIPKTQQVQKKRVWMEIIPKTLTRVGNLQRGNSNEALTSTKPSLSNTNSSGQLGLRTSGMAVGAAASGGNPLRKSSKQREEKTLQLGSRNKEKVCEKSKELEGAAKGTNSKNLNQPGPAKHRAEERALQQQHTDLHEQKGQSADPNQQKPRLRLSKSMRIDLSTEELKLSMQSSVLGTTLQFQSQAHSKLEADPAPKIPVVPALKSVGNHLLQKIPEEQPLPQSARRSSKKKAVEGMSLREMLLQKEKQEILHSMMKRRQISPAPPVKTNFGCWAFQQLKEQKDRQGLKNMASYKNAMVEYFTDKEQSGRRAAPDTPAAASRPGKSSTQRSDQAKTDRALSNQAMVRTNSRPLQPAKKQPRA